MNGNREHKGTIVYAEDTEHIARLVRFKLDREGFQVYHFPDGEKVVMAVEQLKPDLVILDIMMPIKDGLTILKEIKARPSVANIPVILLSSKSQEQTILSGLNSGAADYIMKPFSPAELILRIKKTLN